MMLGVYEPGFGTAILSLFFMLVPLAIIGGIIFLVFRILWLIIKNLEKGLRN